MIRRRTAKLTRSDNGMVLGVFQGIADWTGVNVWVWRVIGIILLCSMHFWAGVALYLLAAILMPSY